MTQCTVDNCQDQRRKCTLIFSNALTFSKGACSEIKGTGKLMFSWSMTLSLRCIGFCFSKCCVQTSNTANVLGRNTNRLIFLHSQFRHGNTSLKSKVSMPKNISLALGNYLSVNKIMFVFTNVLGLFLQYF